MLYHDLGSAPRSLQNGLSTAPNMPYLGPNADGGAAFLSLNTNANYYPGDQALATPLTLEVWAWLQKGGTLQSFFAISDGVFGFELGVDGSNNAHFYDTTGSNNTTQAVSLQHWHHYVLSFTTSACSFYFDGAFVQFGTSAAHSGTFQFQIGAGGTGASPQRFANAAISEVAIYPTALSGAQVSAHYAAADAIAQRPVFRGSGSFDLSTGAVVSDTSQLADVLSCVRKVY